MSDKESSSEAASPGAQPRSNPNCGKCRNHGIIVKLRGHKQGCKFRDCECDCCILTVQRRVVMAAQTAHIRQRKMEEKLVADGVGATPPPVRGDVLMEIPPRPTTPPPNPEAASQHFSRRIISDLEEHSYAANELIKMFSLEMNALPFVYGILGVAGDMRTAIEMVREANKELMTTPPKTNNHAGSSPFARNSSADPQHQSEVLSLVKPRTEGCSRDLNSIFHRNRTPSPPPL